ncbi:hypothetical protein [Rhizobium sp.]|uniref:hypothetical protein n=1 Tax=Rhizobium sp. TaxID=391 RepID=UPI0028B12B2F
MDRNTIIDTIHQRRYGIDLAAMSYEPRTLFASPDASAVIEGEIMGGGLEISA